VQLVQKSSPPPNTTAVHIAKSLNSSPFVAAMCVQCAKGSLHKLVKINAMHARLNVWRLVRPVFPTQSATPATVAIVSMSPAVWKEPARFLSETSAPQRMATAWMIPATAVLGATMTTLTKQQLASHDTTGPATTSEVAIAAIRACATSTILWEATSGSGGRAGAWRNAPKEPFGNQTPKSAGSTLPFHSVVPTSVAPAKVSHRKLGKLSVIRAEPNVAASDSHAWLPHFVILDIALTYKVQLKVKARADFEPVICVRTRRNATLQTCVWKGGV
jgi:hypothetical protein